MMVNKYFGILFFLFFVQIISLTAQENNIYNQILKESLKPDFMKMDIPLEVDSSIYNVQMFKDIEEENIYRMLFRHRIEFLLSEENKNGIHFENTMPKISPVAIQLFYTNPKNELWNNGKFNGNGTFSGEFATKKDILDSKAYKGGFNIVGLICFFVEKTGIVSAEKINVSKESKKAKTLRTIKNDVYHIDD